MHRSVRHSTRRTILATLAVTAGILFAASSWAQLTVETPEMSAGGEASFLGLLQPKGTGLPEVTDDTAPYAPGLTGAWDGIDFIGNATQTGFYQIPPTRTARSA